MAQKRNFPFGKRMDKNQPEIEKALKKHGWTVLRTHAQPGFVDLIAIMKGRILWVEVKSKTGKLTENQKELKAMIERNGGEYALFTSAEAVNGYMREVEKIDSPTKEDCMKTKQEIVLDTVLNNASIVIHKKTGVHDITDRREALLFCRWNIQEAYRHYKDIVNICADTAYFMDKFDINLGDIIPKRMVWTVGKPEGK
ncbi:MAG: hypothetical protein GF364_22600 [Candidatus Lokiarchaeota archaeon]|nr:hypothetical protein [Candidatus Lokiarchaeota archaeon]